MPLAKQTQKRITPKWHKRPPVPGYYSSFWIFSFGERFIDTDCHFYDWQEIRRAEESERVWYYGPLPVKRIGL